ncbi:phage holin family protein [Geobacillus stearothermophilus]|uniref:phage holin family protein n=1 Tax=Geobacillus stearothermophilus TaxID=1422 RepID=UPI000518FD1C|nr:phage holin family protein [Geobacillus stearothermophilus]MED4333309.1 phage holin family protein [Geobacillus stearothermophilus]MED4995897.1 phage holin family protein [Geobacillus stearothermophilus]
MKNTDTLWTAITGGTSITLAYLLGGLDNLVAAFAIFMVCDYITGIIAGAKNKQVSSRRALKGLGKKAGMITFVIVANQLDIITGNQNGFLRDAMLTFLIATEGISIVENLGRLGLNVPTFLVKALEQLSDKEGDKQ